MSNYEPPNPPPPPGDTPPPAGPPGGYGGGMDPARQYSAGEAFNYGWTKFQANIGPIILGVLAIVVVMVILTIIQWTAVIAGGSTVETRCGYDAFGNYDCTTDGGGGLFAAFVIAGLLGLVGLFISFVVYVGIIRASLDITYGQPVTVATIFKTEQMGQILLAALIISIAYVIGVMMCLIPGLIVMFFTQYTPHFIVDKKMPALEAIKASVSFVNKNLGSLVGFYIATLVATVIGAALCGLGLLVATPVVAIASAYTYRTLQGEQVAP